MKIFEDNYCYESQTDYAAIIAAQKELEDETTWDSGKSLSVEPMETPMDAELRASDPINLIPKEILLDTADNAGIMLTYDGKTECLRDCAMPSLLSTAGISGLGIKRASKSDLAVGLSAFLRAARASSKILLRAGKIAAVVSEQYQYMPGSVLLEAVDDLEVEFGKAVFQGGSVSHALTVAEFIYPDSAKMVTDAYQRALSGFSRSAVGDWTPTIQFRTSDTSLEAAKLLVFLKNGGKVMPITGVNVPHIAPSGVQQSAVEKFQAESKYIFNKMILDIQDLIPKMLGTRIDHPGNTFVGLCKYANVPQKWGGVVEEEIRSMYPDGTSCTFLDIYEALTETTGLAIKDGLAPCAKRVLDLEEGIAKVANNRAAWKRYDLPGLVAWDKSQTAA